MIREPRGQLVRRRRRLGVVRFDDYADGVYLSSVHFRWPGHHNNQISSAKPQVRRRAYGPRYWIWTRILLRLRFVPDDNDIPISSF